MPVECEPPKTGREVVRKWKKAMRFTPDLDERATLLAVLGQQTRIRIFYVLDRVGEVCVCDLAEILSVTQSAVSQHLAKLRACGVVAARRDNQTLFYALADHPEMKRLRRLAFAGIEDPTA